VLHVFKGLDDDDFLEEFDHSNFLFKNCDCSSEIRDCNKSILVLNGQGIKLNGELAKLSLELFHLVVVVLSSLENENPISVLLDVNDQLVVLLSNGVIVVSAGIKLSPEDLAVVNQSVEEIKFWREGTEVETLEGASDFTLLVKFNLFDFLHDHMEGSEMVAKASGALGWGEEPSINMWWWSNDLNIDDLFLIDHFWSSNNWLINRGSLLNIHRSSLSNWLNINWSSLSNWLIDWSSLLNVNWSSLSNYLSWDMSPVPSQNSSELVMG